MARTAVNILVLLVAIAGGFYQFFVEPALKQFGRGRVIESLNNKDCIKVPELTACEKIVLHPPTGNIYLTCSTVANRVQWMPTISHLNASGASRDDYVAIYNPTTSTITRLKIKGYTSDRGLSLHGMDVVPSSDDPSKLHVYLINHRAPLGGKPATEVGADSSVELFHTAVGSDTLNWVATVEDPVIITPNDLIGSPDGKSFWFTNDHGEKTGIKREFDFLFRRRSTSVGICHLGKGCKLAITGMHGNNGIAQAPNGTIYVANSLWGGLSILEPQSDDSLVLVDHIKTDRGMDNVYVDANGQVWAAAFSNVFDLLKYFKDPTLPSPSSALRFSINTGSNAFYGEKYKVEKIFEDDGSLASGITSVVYDVERNRLFMDGLSSPQLVVCKL